MKQRAIINLPVPTLQIEFSSLLSDIRCLYLQDALLRTVSSLPVRELDSELSELVPADFLSSLASRGLRGELLFAVPSVLRANPRLLGYYRMLLGFSQKEFYSSRLGVSRFKSMEMASKLASGQDTQLPELCGGLIRSACGLLDGIGVESIGRDLLDDLTLLTLGAQLRGSANVKIGSTGSIRVFEIIKAIVSQTITRLTPERIELENAAGRKVVIQFSSDPDIVIQEEMAHNEYRKIIAIEVKAGTDASNIHNRIGEAEKSHQKAKFKGFNECWTIVNVDRLDLEKARRESPTTNRFYSLKVLESQMSHEYQDFRNRLIGLTSIRGRGRRNPRARRS